MSPAATPEKTSTMVQQQTQVSPSEKTLEDSEHLEMTANETSNLAYSQDDEEPELHARTYFAVAAMFVLNMVQVLALQGPPTVVSIDRVMSFFPTSRQRCLPD